MRRRVAGILAGIALLTSGSVYAQTPRESIRVDSNSDVTMSVEQDLSNLMRTLEEARTGLQQRQYEASERTLTSASQALQKEIQGLEGQGSYREVVLGYKKIDLSLQDVLWAVQARRPEVALKELDYALDRLRALQESPVLKLSVTRNALRLANRDIAGKNYSSAGLFLQQAIDALTSLESNSKIDLPQIKALKSDIVVAHQQVILGKASGKKYWDHLYDRANAATTNVFYQYYDMWTMTPSSWSQH